ncbi:MAG TPA: DUF58 domain-containing protein [Pirellulaceae bacterium]|nr:DUF58 domain-containing protein [Pirellulaceae bacterium]
MSRFGFTAAPTGIRRLAAWAERDWFPGSRRYTRWLRSPLSWLSFAVVASAVVGATAAPHGWIVFVVLLHVLLAGIAWPWLALRGLSARWEFERIRCVEGERTKSTLTVTNRWPWPVWGLEVWLGPTPFESDAEGRPWAALARVDGWSTTRYEFELNAPRRGRFPENAPRVATGFPFGLWRASRPLTVPVELLVWPRFAELNGPPALGDGRFSPTGVCVDRAGHDGDILGVRPFRHGDSLRHVHWLQTARRDELIVRERQTATQRRIRITLDETAVFSSDAADEAARVVAALAREIHRQNCDLECLIGGDACQLGANEARLDRVLDRLADWTPNSTNAPSIDTPPTVPLAPEQSDKRSTAIRSTRATTGASLPTHTILVTLRPSAGSSPIHGITGGEIGRFGFARENSGRSGGENGGDLVGGRAVRTGKLDVYFVESLSGDLNESATSNIAEPLEPTSPPARTLAYPSLPARERSSSRLKGAVA